MYKIHIYIYPPMSASIYICKIWVYIYNIDYVYIYNYIYIYVCRSDNHIIWLVVSTPLKNINQWEGLSHVLW